MQLCIGRRFIRARCVVRVFGAAYLIVILITLLHFIRLGEQLTPNNNKPDANDAPNTKYTSRPNRSALSSDANKCILASPGKPPGYSMEDHLRAWPQEKTKGFVYLTISPAMVQAAIPLLQSIHTYFNKRFQYPVILFSESPDAEHRMREAIAYLGPQAADSVGQVFVYDISRFWQVPSYVLQRHDNDTEKLVAYAYASIRDSGCMFPANLGYWHMCRFQSKGIVDIPFVQEFDYLWRLDLDAQLCGDLNFDIFAYMQKHDYWQGYLAEDTWDSCAQKLTEHVHKFVKEYNIVPVQGLNSIEDARTWYIYNNFEIFKVEFFLSKGYQLFMNFTDRSGGFYYYRWGDAPVRTQASRLFMPKEKMHEFKVGEIFYRHQSFDRCPKV